MFFMIAERMKQVLRRAGITQKQAATMLGITAGEMSHWFVGRNGIKAEDVQNFCQKFGCSPNYLMYGEQDTQTIPVIGYVQAGLWQEARQWEVSDFKPIYMPTDERFWGRRIYALQVRGNSMNKLYPEGSCVICVSAEDYTDIVGQIESGKKVVVQRKNPLDGTIEATVKEFVKNESGTFLVPHSTDLTFTPIRIDDGSAGYTEITGVVIGSFRKE